MMALKLSPVDQFIAARVQERYASSRVADVNEYQSLKRRLENLDSWLDKLRSTTDWTIDEIKGEYLGKIEKASQGLPQLVDRHNTDAVKLKRYFTKLDNLVSVMRQTHPLRVDVGPILKFLVAFHSKLPNENKNWYQLYIKEDLFPVINTIRLLIEDWKAAATKFAGDVNNSGLNVAAEPTRSGFGEDPEWEKYAIEQRKFAEESNDLTRLLVHTSIGIVNAGPSFEDCADPEVTLKTMIKTLDSCVKLHTSFGKKWGDYRAKLQGKFSPQRSLL